MAQNTGFHHLQPESCMPGKAAKIVFTEKQQVILRECAASRSVSVALVQRSKIILVALDGLNNEQIEAIIGLGRDQVGKWRRRWLERQNKLIAIECGQAPIDPASGYRANALRCPTQWPTAHNHSRAASATGRQGLVRTNRIPDVPSLAGRPRN